MFDVIIQNGVIADGTGSCTYTSDIGLAHGKIKAIGNFDPAATKTMIDAAGKIVCPGFIDIHTHSDFTLIADPRAQSAVHQGVTCEVIGQCGFGAAPLPDKSIIKNLFGYHPSVKPQWDSLASYLDCLEKTACALNVAALVGHAPLRYAAIKGGQAKADEKAIDAMCSMLDEALAAGYWGFSIGLEYEPGMHASTNELLALAKIVSQHDKLMACHVRNRDLYYDMAFAEIISIARQTGVRLQISHISPKYGAPDDAVENTIAMIEACNSAGGRVGFDIIPDNWGPTTMASILPDWVLANGIDRAIDHLGSDASRHRMKEAPNPIWQLVTDKRWDLIRLVSWIDKSSRVGKTIEQIAMDMGVADPHDAVLDMLKEAGTDMFGITWAGRNFDETMQKKLLSHELCGVISDAQTVAPEGPLADKTGAPSVYGWTAQLFAKYVKQEKLLTIPQAVHKLTGLPASRMNFADRGLLRPGYNADITIFDPETIACRATLQNSRQFPSGFEHVMINGLAVMAAGKRTKVNSGMILRSTTASNANQQATGQHIPDAAEQLPSPPDLKGCNRSGGQ